MTVYKPQGVNPTAASLVFDLPFKPESLQALQAHLQVWLSLQRCRSLSVPHKRSPRISRVPAGCLH